MRTHPLPRLFTAAVILTLAALLPTPGLAQSEARPTANKALERLEWRSIGPANMGGRVADVEGVPGNPNLVYVATGSGGIFKTTNGGMSWTPIFERQGTMSVGDIALEPNNPDVIWVGTGEGNPRNSVSFGDGVYKSLDGGRTWRHLGLRDSNSINRILLHPTNPNIAYVAAQGHIWGANEERGVFMTTDGGESWKKTLYLDTTHGAADLEMDPQNPNILYAGMWHFERKPWTFTSGSEKGGVYRSLDGGRTWNKLTNGLPKLIGRISVRVAPSNANIVYVLLESREGALYRSDDKGENFQLVYRNQNIVQRGFYYTTVRVDPQNENRVYAVSSPLFVSLDGGRNFQMISPNTHIDYHALWIDPTNPKYMWQGQDGGVAVTRDGEKWEYINNFPTGQFYQVYADNRQPFYYLSGGLQDNGSWTGPSRTREPAGILNDDWRMVSFGDGFYAINHADDPDLYLTESQGGSVVRTDMRNREQQSVIPYVGGGGGAAENLKYRFNWNAPLVPSPHDKNTVYLGGNVVFKSTDFGKSWAKISDDLTTNDKTKQKSAGGPVANENTSAEYYCTILSIAESPRQAGMIWAGTDDGNVQLTTDSGRTWTNLSKNIKGIPEWSSVSHIEPSRTNANTAYVAFDRHKMDDYRPYVYKTTDGGKSFKNVSEGLPRNAYVHALLEDPKNANLIYAGTELGLFASYTGGENWMSLGLKNLPHVAVHDIVVHPRDNDLILATHGRSLWVFDDATPIQQMNANVLNSDATLFDIRPALRFTTRFTRYGIGDALYQGPNPPAGALLYYYLKDKPDAKTPVKMQVFDSSGKMIREFANIPKEAGLNRAVWDLTHAGATLRRQPTPEQMQFFGGARGAFVMPGTYTVKLLVGDKAQEKRVEVRVDPTVRVTEADLQAQFDLAMKLQTMQSGVNLALRALDSISTQVEQIERTVREQMPAAPQELTKAIADYKKQLEETLGSISPVGFGGGGLGGGPPKLANGLNSLFFGTQGVNAAPTPAQQEYFNELQTEYQQKMGNVVKFANESVAPLNEVLRRHGAPTVIVPKPVELPR